MTRLVTIVKGVSSALLLALFVVGMPAGLVRIGAFPDSVPDLPTVLRALTGPDTSGRAVFAVLAVIVWLLWAAFTISVLREIGAAIRTRGYRPVLPVSEPGPGGSARPAALLVTAIVAMFVAAPVLTAAVPHAAAAGLPGTLGAPGHGGSLDGHRATATTTATAVQYPGPARHTVSPPSRHAGPATAAGHQQATSSGHRTAGPTSPAASSAPAAASGHTRYTVNRHDTLWSIAERQLGDPLRYHEIAALNAHLGPDFEIHTGQVLTLPTAHHHQPAPAVATGPAVTQTAAQAPEGHVTVVKGDTLSEIAAEHGVSDWRTIWPANADKAEPGGKHLNNPDHIEPGWDITLARPAASPAATSAAPPPAAAPTTTPATPQPPASELAPGPQPITPTPAAGRHSPQDLDQPAAVSDPPAPGGASVPTAAATTATPTTTSAPSAPARAAGDASATPAPPGLDRVGQSSSATVAGFAAGGGILAAGVFGALALVRRQQFRDRRPGRSIAATGPGLVPVERATVTVGGPAAAEVARLNEVLCRVAASDAETLQVAAVQLTDGHIIVHLALPVVLADPWRPGDTAGLIWRFPAAAETHTAGPDPDDTSPVAPYPTLVHLGSDATSCWLLDLEQVGALVLTGDPTRCLQLARVLAAQLGLTPWADSINVTLVGFGQELVDAAPSRLRYAASSDAAAVLSEATAWAVSTADFAASNDVTVVQGRRRAVADEAWLPHALLICGDALPAGPGSESAGTSPVAGLFQLLATRHGATGTALVFMATDFDPDTAQGGATVARVDAAGTLTLPAFGLTVTAGGWDEDTACGVAMLLAHARTAGDEKIPDAAGEQPWKAYSDAAGALRGQLVHHRAAPDVHDSARVAAACLLPLADEVYLEAAATTTDDLNVLAPNVPADVRPRVEEADPTLDAEVAAWFQRDCQQPRLSLLGPLTVRAPRVEAKHLAPYLEHIAYLATREHGATVDQVAEAFTIAPGTARKYVHNVRDLFGVRPDTGQEYVPHADKTEAGKARGVGVYQLAGLIVDADLFLRLRLRGQARRQHGIDDYATALRLVTGTPFAHVRSGAAWLIGGDRLDHYYTAAIVDVAHIVTTNALAAGDTSTARAVVDIAQLAAPHEEIPRLDAAAVAAAEGHPDSAHRIVIDQVCNRSDDGLPPMQLNERTKQILTRHRDWLSRAS